MNKTSHTKATATTQAQRPGPGLHRRPRQYRRGVCYDVGRNFGGPSTRPRLDPRVVRRELDIIKHDLHCNAVRICGTDIGRIKRAATHALSLGLETWLCPELFEHDQATTLRYITSAARAAETLRRRWPGRVVLSLGTELTWFMPGILDGRNFTERITAPTFWEQIRSATHAASLNAFLASATEAARRTFGGPVTYASAPLEPVDWSMFDLACLDLYRDAANRASFAAQLDPAFAHGKEVIVSEVGCCTYRGAEDDGGMGWAIIDYSASPLELGGGYKRDETLQASELTSVLELLEDRGVDGVFVMTFVSPTLIHTHDPRTDLDMASFSLVKSYQNRQGTTYPGMPWEPKQAFCAVAEHFARLASAPLTATTAR